jgi:Zn-dependent protease with chaperone function
MLATTPDIASGYVPRPRDESPIHVDRWPSEIPLLVFVALASLFIWGVFAITIIGLVYVAILGVFFFVAHAVLVAHVRGSGVRLGPEQFPELHHSVERLAQRIGMQRIPETYLMQAGGTLNAFASKFMRTNIVVLFSDLLEACGDDDAARDMIIAHELGHIHAGHLRWAWFLLPGSFVPFLGTALSRAREYTCDRYGLAGAGRRDSALVGLAILAAGGKHGPHVNREAMVKQREQLNTGWMRLAEWLSTHPPLASRMAALDPALDAMTDLSSAGTVRALGIIGAAVLLPMVASFFAVAMIIGAAGAIAGAAQQDTAGDPEAALQAFMQSAAQPSRGAQAAQLAATDTAPAPISNVGEELSRIQVGMDLEALAGVVELERLNAGIPIDLATLYAKAAERNPGEPERRDAFGGQRYAYEQHDGHYILRSAGPDGQHGTADDIVRDSRAQ